MDEADCHHIRLDVCGVAGIGDAAFAVSGRLDISDRAESGLCVARSFAGRGVK